jgi:hypothetical protein
MKHNSSHCNKCIDTVFELKHDSYIFELMLFIHNIY